MPPQKAFTSCRENQVIDLSGEKKKIEISYATRIKGITSKIEEAHRLNNDGWLDNYFKQNLERDVIYCFM